MKLPLLFSLLIVTSSSQATKMTPNALPNLANFFATKKLQDIENKINNTVMFSEKGETPADQAAFEEAVYNIGFKNNVLSIDEKMKAMKLLKDKAKKKSSDIRKLVSMGAWHVSALKRNTQESSQDLKKIGLSPESQALFYAVSLDSLLAVKLLLKHGADINATNALWKAAENEDLTLAKYLVEQGAHPERSKNSLYGPSDFIQNKEDLNKFYFQSLPIITWIGFNPSGDIYEKPIKFLLDAGWNINRIGYYKIDEGFGSTSESPEKQGTLLDLVYDVYDFFKQQKLPEGKTQKDIDPALAGIQKSIAMLKKYGAKRMVELKK